MLERILERYSEKFPNISCGKMPPNSSEKEKKILNVYLGDLWDFSEYLPRTFTYIPRTFSNSYFNY